MRFFELFETTEKLTPDERSSWIARNAKETPIEKVVRRFTEEEKIEFALESSLNGRGINKLNGILKTITGLITKGTEGNDKAIVLVLEGEESKPNHQSNDKQTVITIPLTVGTKKLDAQRRQNDDMLETGMEIDEIQLYGIPSSETECMEFFNSDGVHYPDLSRSLSMKEKKAFFGAFARLTIHKEGVVDTDTGEIDQAQGF